MTALNIPFFIICETSDHNMQEKMPSIFLRSESYLNQIVYSKFVNKLVLRMRKRNFYFAPLNFVRSSFCDKIMSAL